MAPKRRIGPDIDVAGEGDGVCLALHNFGLLHDQARPQAACAGDDAGHHAVVGFVGDAELTGVIRVDGDDEAGLQRLSTGDLRTARQDFRPARDLEDIGTCGSSDIKLRGWLSCADADIAVCLDDRTLGVHR